MCKDNIVAKGNESVATVGILEPPGSIQELVVSSEAILSRGVRMTHLLAMSDAHRDPMC